ncbi:MAG: hypothetical protein KDA96_26170 [Planctomycetaceae bacterium]|nr:hypothetical protein [Planctomycetaceae bacterium]
MSDVPEAPSGKTDAAAPETADGAGAKPQSRPDRVYLVSYPKIIYLYPTVIAAVVCALVMWAKGDLKAATMPAAEPVPAAANAPAEDGAAADAADDADAAKTPTFHHTVARFFLLLLTVNLVVVSFDFPRTTSLTWFFAIVAIVIGLWTLFHLKPGLLPTVQNVIFSITPAANASFYLIYAIAMIFLFGCVVVSRRFDYWEVRGNELLHHHGVLSDLERFSAPNLRIDKEINDVFEYLLLRSGRLILHPSNERRAIVLENVLFINDKENRITRMLGALQVRVRTDPQ